MIYNVENGERVFEQNGCIGTRLYESSGNEYVHLAIEPGGEIPEHALPIPVSFYVLSGRGTCLVNGTGTDMVQGDMIECLPNLPRGWSNASGEQLEVLVIKRSVH